MKLQNYRDDFYTFSGKASDLNRQLAFAGIALVWLFKKDSLAGLSIPQPLLLPTIFIVASLVFDMFHYCAASIIWRRFYRQKEQANVGEDRELTHSVWHERPLWVLFCIKITFVVLAYLAIGCFLLGNLGLR